MTIVVQSTHARFDYFVIIFVSKRCFLMHHGTVLYGSYFWGGVQGFGSTSVSWTPSSKIWVDMSALSTSWWRPCKAHTRQQPVLFNSIEIFPL